MRWVVGILLTIFLIPVCLAAGAFGGCLVGVVFGSVSSSDTAAVAAIISGIVVGLGAGIALVVLAVRNIGSSNYRG